MENGLMNKEQKDYIADICGMLILEQKDLESKKKQIDKRLSELGPKIKRMTNGFSDQEIQAAISKTSKYAAKMVEQQQNVTQ